ncbi:hypothetical protein [Staphylococcus aureus]|uniref:hypothetical protein n=1 Tax=Staphylococcus aureus TaxID=1280 RepID=UPI000E050E4D|nr:hypothetical protein [Staphylococcus aureus]SUK03238.1 Uncharacterised protein [Staphylococcus aureus]SUK11041.1 Uncharacterised protein [Staphylococcus aureus]HDP5919716.1 hypothetical protein [Staphylococcus aureus]
MDKQILNYLDKVGEKLSGVTAKGFDIYVHGVFVKSIVWSIFSFVGIIACIVTLIVTLKLTNKAKRDKEECIFYSAKYDFTTVLSFALTFGSSLMGFLLFLALVSNVVGIFAPDYVVIKEIIKSIGGK